MKHFFRCLLCAALLASAALLTACDDKVKVDVHLTYDTERGALVEDSLGLEYSFASVSYEPAAYTEPYADWEDIVLYTVDGWDPRELLTEEFSGVGGLLYASDKPLPPLSEMNADTIYICTAASSIVCLSQIDDEAVVSEAVSYLTDGEAVTLPEDGDTTFHLKFLSDDYAGIYYNVIFIGRGEGEEGSYFLYDRGDKKCVEIPYSLFYGWLYDDTADTVSDDGMYEIVPGGDDLEFSFDGQA